VRNISSPTGIEYFYSCFNATDDRPCSPYASCSAYNDTECGYLFSTADQVGFCEVQQPPLWPALLQIPRRQFRTPKYPDIDPQGIPPPKNLPLDATPMLYTGDDKEIASKLMDSMWKRGQTITEAAQAAYLRAQATGQNIPTSTEGSNIASEKDFVEAAGSLTRGLYEFGLVMGTSSFTSVTMLMEPAFVATSSGSADGATSRPPLYFAQPNCSTLSTQDLDMLARIGEAITNMTGFPVECVSLPAAQQATYQLMNDQVYTGWLSSESAVRNGSIYQLTKSQVANETHPVQEFPGALYDWRDTDPSSGRFRVAVFVNNSNVARDPGVPDIQRWSQPVNLAANAYLKEIAGPTASGRLAGVRDMPKGSTQLSLDFSSLLGPLFMMWFFQLMLPVNVYSLVHEKEHHLRIMQRMQGLGDAPYYAVQYLWMVGMYCVFAAIFVAVGSGIGLKIFTLNSYGVQIVFYLLWGNLLASFSFFFAAVMKEARPAVLLAVIYVIITGFVANLVMVQYVEQGPIWVADVMQIIPAFSLFRGLYELAQYAFLADRNQGQGLTWNKMLDPDCGMAQVWFYLLVEWAVLPLIAYWLEQVTGAGTGVKRHPLFFLGMKHNDLKKIEKMAKKQNKKKKHPSSSSFTTNEPTKTAATETEAETETETETTSQIQSPTLDYYYGAAPAAGAALSPKLTTEGIQQAPSKVNKTSTIADASHMVARAVTSVARKVTSVRLDLSGGGASGSGGGASNAKEQQQNKIQPEVKTTQTRIYQEGVDVSAERSRVEDLWQQWSLQQTSSKISQQMKSPAAILLHNLRKIYPTKDGNKPKIAVHDLSLAIDRCECFGLLGPNGAGKTTTIRLMEGFLDPSSGEILIEGLSIPGDIESIYGIMGACPQHDLLWEGLTAREHLLFYGRLKNLGGTVLKRAVNDGLRSVNLFDVGDNLVSSYSGGMKRRLSVAIALMGDPLVVYLDEPSTGLDPSSRHLLWEVIKNARKNKAVVLTTHSMEEAEALCDRLGIFVGGKLQCVGNPKDLTARFGGYLSFTITTPPHQEAAAKYVVMSMAPNARLVYALGGTQKYELPLSEVEIDTVFRRMEEVKLTREIELQDWGVSNATLEEVFIKITREAGVSMSAWTG
jgi:ABC-type multidrug transport system ATPase subunit